MGPSFLSMFSGIGAKMPDATLLAFDTLNAIWAFPIALGILFVLLLAVVLLPTLRGKYLLRVPAFKEATVARIASSINLLLKNGVSLPDAISA